MVNLPTGILGGSIKDMLADTGSGTTLIPEGIYRAMAVEGALKDTSTGGVMLVLKFVITEGPYANTELTDRLNIVNTSPATVAIALKTLARIGKAVGLPEETRIHEINTDILLRKHMLIQVKTEAGKPWVNNQGETVDGKDKSVIDGKGYKPLLTGAAATTATPTTGAATPPWMQ